MSAPSAPGSNHIKGRLSKLKRAPKSIHVVNQVHHDDATFGEILADKIASGIGSWRFLIIQTGIVAAWMVFNGLQVTGRLHFDPVPYILLNLAFSTQAAYTGPVLLLAGNRQSQKDRLTLEHAAMEAQQSEEHTRTILTEIKRNTELTVQILDRMEEQHRELLRKVPGKV